MKKQKILQSIQRHKELPSVLKGLTITPGTGHNMAITKYTALHDRQSAVSPLPLAFYKPISKL